jgi:hypothetical protein
MDGWDPGLALLEALVAGQQQRFGGGVVLLGQQAAAEETLGGERPPFVGQFLLADLQAVPEQGLGVRRLAGFEGQRSRGEGDSRTVEARKRDGHLAAIVAARRLALLNFSVEMSKKRDARRNFSQYLNGDNFMGESVQCQTER